MITKEQKKVILDELIELFRTATGVYIVNFRGMTVKDAQDFRKEIKAVNCVYKVAKNTLLLKAVSEIKGIELPVDKMVLESGVVFAYDDPTVPAQVIKKFFDAKQKPVLKVASLDGQLFDGSELKRIAALPSKKDLYSGIVGSLGAPASGIHGVLSNLMGDLTSLIEEVAKKQNNAA